MSAIFLKILKRQIVQQSSMIGQLISNEEDGLTKGKQSKYSVSFFSDIKCLFFVTSKGQFEI